MKIEKTGAWGKLGRLLETAPKRLKEASDKALMQEAQFFRTQIVEGITSQAPAGRAFTPLAPTTLAIRKFRGFQGTKALLVNGDLRNSITVTKEGGRIFVGVLRTAKSRNGRSLVNIARLHEDGSRPIIVQLSPKARAFLHAAFRAAGLPAPPRGAGTGLAIIRVPARPFLAPVFEKFGSDERVVARRFFERVARNLHGDFGQVDRS